MAFNSFEEIREAVKSKASANGSPAVLALAAAEDADALSAAAMAEEMGVVKCILVGDEEKIRTINPNIKSRIVDVKNNPAEAAAVAVRLVANKEAQILMKGLVNSGDFLKAVLKPEDGLRTGSLLSHLSVYEVAGRLYLITDGGMNIAPGIDEKVKILQNALGAARKLGIENPNVACLTANERVSNNMIATVHAEAIAKMAEEGVFPGCVVEGPIALDVAVSPEAAKHKGIASVVSGKVDIFLMPNIEAGNMFGKSLSYFAGAKMAGLIMGAKAPVVMTSRSDSAIEKCSSIACAALIAM